MHSRLRIVLVVVLALLPRAVDAQPRVANAPALSYAGREEWWVRNPDGCSLYVAEFGRGSPVVMVHGGFGAEHGYLVDAVDGLAGKYHFVFYDQRGSLRSPFRVYEKGGSEACPDSLITLAKHVSDLERLRSQLGVERISIVAHSMGVLVALSYLEQFPQHVGGLVLLSPGIPLRPVTDAALLASQKAASNALFENPQIEVERQKAGVDHTPLSDKQTIEEWRIRFAAANIYDVSKWRDLRGGMAFYNPKAASDAGRGVPVSYDFVAVLRARACPTAIVLGDHDIADMGARVIHQQVAGVDNVKLTVLKNAGHVVWVDQPAAVRDAIDQGLSMCP
jgi:proline iminopeptidase